MSNTLTEPLPWENSTLLSGDAQRAVEELKQQPGKDLVAPGGGELVRDLLRTAWWTRSRCRSTRLCWGPAGRLFAEGGPLTAWRLASSVPTTTGVVIETTTSASRRAHDAMGNAPPRLVRVSKTHSSSDRGGL